MTERITYPPNPVSLEEIPTRRHDQLQRALAALGPSLHAGADLGMLAQSGLRVTRGNSAAEQDLLSAVIPAGTLLGASYLLALEAWGGFINNTALARTCTWRLYLPTAVNLFTTGALSFPQGATQRPWSMAFYAILPDVYAGSTVVRAAMWFGAGPLGSYTNSGVGPTLITLGVYAFDLIGGSNYATANLDWTIAQTIRLTEQLSLADINLAINIDGYTLRYMPIP